MLLANLSHFDCNYLFEDFGHPSTLILSNSLGTNYSMWDDNIPFLKNHFNILRYDKRGHGKSSINQKTLSIADLGGDVVELLDYLKLDKVFFCGLSIGGLTGQWLGINHPNRFEKIVISNTAAKIGTPQGWQARVEQVTKHGLGSILEPTAERWFTERFRQQHPGKVATILQAFQANALQGYVACCLAVAEANFTEQVSHIEVPILIIAGTQDLVTTVDDAQFIQKNTPVATLETLEAAHLSNLEFPETFAQHIIQFIKN